MIGDRPVYRFGGRDQTIVYADTGEFYEGIVDKNQAAEVARRYAPGHTGPIRYAEVPDGAGSMDPTGAQRAADARVCPR